MNYVEDAVVKFKSKNRLGKVTYNKLLKLCRRNEYIVKSYSKSETFMAAMGVLRKAQKSNSIFAKDDEGNVLIFIRDGLSEDKKIFALAHEIGHITLGHNEDTDESEIEANCFAHFLLENQDINKVERFTPLIIILLLVVIGVLFIDIYNLRVSNKSVKTSISKEEASFTTNGSDICYFTKYGEVYHLYADCQYLKNSKKVYTNTIDTCSKDRICSVCERRNSQ